MKKIAVLLGTLVVSAIALLSMHRSFAHATPSTEAVSVFARNETLSSQMTLDKTSVITPGVLTFHEADETIIYNWFTYVPENMSQTEISYILVAGLHGSVTGKYDEVTELSRVMAEERTAWADKYRYILLVPVVPRSGQFYPVAFDLASFRGATDPFYQRPDLKVNLMIDQFISDLRTEGYNVHGKVFIEGKSAGGMFAQRYTLLHPERVWAIVAGAGHCGGAITLPESFCNSTPMDYAVGVNDFSSLVGYEFDRSTYMQVPQFIYIGEYDTEHTTVTPDHIGGFWTSQDQVDFLNDHFGDTDPVRPLVRSNLGKFRELW
jgi:hypothetical protein